MQQGIRRLNERWVSTGRPEVPLRCEARPYPWTSGLVRIEIREPAVAIPSPVQPVRPDPLGCSTLSELLEPDHACAAPDGPVCSYLIHPTAGASTSALPDLPPFAALTVCLPGLTKYGSSSGD